MTNQAVVHVTVPWIEQPVPVPVRKVSGTWWVSTGAESDPSPSEGQHGRDHRWGFADDPSTRVAHPSISAAWDATAAWFGTQTRAVQIRRLFTSVALTDAEVLDLSDPDTQDLLGVNKDLLVARDPSVCQYLGRACWDAGVATLRVPTPTDDRVAIVFTARSTGVDVTDEQVEEFSPAGWPVVAPGHEPRATGSAYVQLITGQTV